MRAFAFAVLLFCGCAAAADGGAWKGMPGEPEEAVVRASLDWLVNILPSGDAEAEEKYVGKTLLVEGWVQEMGRDKSGWYVDVRRYSARPTALRCYFADGGGQLDYVYKGMTIELMGECRGYDAERDAVVFRDSRVVVQDFRPDLE